MIEEVDTGIAFDGSSNCIVVTKDFTRMIRLKKIGSGFQVIGFGSPEAMMGICTR
jgi:hypothetical protein